MGVSMLPEVGGNGLQANNGRQEFFTWMLPATSQYSKGERNEGQERNVVRDQHTAKKA